MNATTFLKIVMAQYRNSLEFENDLILKAKPRKIWPILRIWKYEVSIHYNVTLKQVHFAIGRRFFEDKFFQLKWFI